MTRCKHCGELVEWDTYWTTWDHTGRKSKMTAELCYPELGFEDSSRATPTTEKVEGP